jgi:hypothetical protein
MAWNVSNIYEKYRMLINREKFLRVEGVLQESGSHQINQGFPRATHLDYCCSDGGSCFSLG